MSKKSALSTIKKIIQENQITKTEVLEMFPKSTKLVDEPKKIFDFLGILNYIGGLILLFGLVFVVSLFWSDLGDIGQVVMTLGIGLVTFGIAIISDIKKSQEGIANPFFLVASLLIPFGVFVFLDKLESSDVKISLVSGIVFLIMSGVYYLVDKKLQRNILSSFVWIYSIISFGSFVGHFLELLPDLSHRIVAFGFFIFATISILIARKK